MQLPVRRHTGVREDVRLPGVLRGVRTRVVHAECAGTTALSLYCGLRTSKCLCISFKIPLRCGRVYLQSVQVQR